MSYYLRKNGEQIAVSGGWNPRLFSQHTGASFPASVPQGWSWYHDGWSLTWEDDPIVEVRVTPEQIIAQYEAALDEHLDAVAQADRWDDRRSFALRAAYPNPWQQKATAYGTWMDACNAQSYTLMQQVLAGEIEIPSIEDFIASLPVYTP